jgi:hypothetical protein
VWGWRDSPQIFSSWFPAQNQDLLYPPQTWQIILWGGCTGEVPKKSWRSIGLELKKGTSHQTGVHIFFSIRFPQHIEEK